ncbi:MAG: hypothetical protein JRM80_02950 [Nitrososphaerota archaeon]|nr:hypothetical protein [Nitrososphaerota archaeon]
MTRPLVLLADTTVLYSALVYKGPESKVLFSGGHIFATTEYTIAEVDRILTAKMGMSPADARSLVEAMPVLVADRKFLSERWAEAERLIARRDRSDVPLVALALTTEGHHDGIWSTDGDFDVVRGRFKVWKTRELAKG